MSDSSVSSWFRIEILKAYFQPDKDFRIASGIIYPTLSTLGYSINGVVGEFSYPGYSRPISRIALADDHWLVGPSPDYLVSNNKSISFPAVIGNYILATSFYLMQQSIADPSYDSRFYWGGNISNTRLLLQGVIPKFNVGDIEFVFFNI